MGVDLSITYWEIYLRGPQRIRTKYRIVKATDAEGKRRKKKWVVRRYYHVPGYRDWNEPDNFYFSKREDAARWVVLDA